MSRFLDRAMAVALGMIVLGCSISLVCNTILIIRSLTR